MILKTWLQARRLNRKAAKGPYPVHGRSLGYLGTGREPYTWFVCNNGHTAMGSPWAKPSRDCWHCEWHELRGAEGFTGWIVADSSLVYQCTMNAIGPAKNSASLYRRTQT